MMVGCEWQCPGCPVNTIADIEKRTRASAAVEQYRSYEGDEGVLRVNIMIKEGLFWQEAGKVVAAIGRQASGDCVEINSAAA